MQKYSNKEYEHLKTEISEIKKCITRYIGYIIGISGVTTIVSKYLYVYSSSTVHNGFAITKVFLAVIILVSLVITTYLFEILWYKFKSHNRHAGYMQLMSQEINAYNLTDDIKYNDKKPHLYDPSCLDKFEGNLDILSWDFMMSRLTNVSEKSDIEAIKNATRKSTFIFSKSKLYNLSKIENYKDLDSLFFEFCIYRKYFPRIKSLRRKRIMQSISNLVYIWIPSKQKNIIDSIDEKYTSISWKYPIKLIQLGTLSILALSFSFFYFLSMSYDPIWSGGLDTRLFNMASLLVCVWVIVILRWIFVYIGKFHQLLSGIYSIEYYCWQFFIFRTQYLNAKGILPEFYSRDFVRFFKTQGILTYLENNMKGQHSQYKEYLQQLKEFDTEELKSLHATINPQAKKFYQYNAEDYFRAKLKGNMSMSQGSKKN